jgi:predicted ATPase
VLEQRTGTIFVGRERELGELLRALEDAASGRGRLVLLAGEPGIGKSRLADELAARARERGARVLWGKCWEEAGAPAYWPWVQALRSYLRSSDPEQVRAQLGQGAGAIAQMLPEIESIVPDLVPPPPADPESARFRLFDATTTFLVNASRDTVLVLVIDDLHAADTASIRFLRFLASQLAESRILVVATYRDVELTPDDPLSADLSELTRESITRLLPIAGLSQSEVGNLIEATAGRELRSQLVSVLWHETGGNPLFLGEAVRMLSAEGRLDEAVDPSLLRVSVPPGVRDVITRRVRQLGPPAVRTLTLGAVLGPEFSLESLRSVGEYGAEELLDLLDRPLQAGLLIHVPGSLGRLRFSHDLVRETLYGDLAPATRVRLHSRVALALEALYGADADTHLAELAHHFFEAARGGDASRAVSYARDAGDEAVRSLAYEEAVRFYTMGLQALELAPSADADFQGELLLALGDAQARAGDLEQGRDTFLRAAGIARRTGAASQLAQRGAWLWRPLHLGTGW